MPDTSVINEPIVVSNPTLQDTFYVAHWTGTVFEDAQISFGTLANAVGGALASQEIQETPIGLIDGINADFLLSQMPVGNLTVYKNGLLQKIASSGDLMVSNRTLTFAVDAIPLPGDLLTAIYHT